MVETHQREIQKVKKLKAERYNTRVIKQGRLCLISERDSNEVKRSGKEMSKKVNQSKSRDY